MKINYIVALNIKRQVKEETISNEKVINKNQGRISRLNSLIGLGGIKILRFTNENHFLYEIVFLQY